MECIFHVDTKDAPDWIEQRSNVPLPGAVVQHWGNEYEVFQAAQWMGSDRTAFIAVRARALVPHCDPS
jgi:hypothetical protein